MHSPSPSFRTRCVPPTQHTPARISRSRTTDQSTMHDHGRRGSNLRVEGAGVSSRDISWVAGLHHTRLVVVKRGLCLRCRLRDRLLFQHDGSDRGPHGHMLRFVELFRPMHRPARYGRGRTALLLVHPTVVPISGVHALFGRRRAGRVSEQVPGARPSCRCWHFSATNPSSARWRGTRWCRPRW